jgi:two-component system chemotaxis sensor kinase CheA
MIDQLNRLKENVKKSEQTETELSNLIESLRKIKMVNLDSVFSRLANIVSDVSRTCGKEAVLEAQGDGILLEQEFQNELCNALVHMVRNSIDHGIEWPEDREEKRKAREGKVSLIAVRNKGNFEIVIQDDGKGLDPEKILKIGIEKGLVSEDDGQNLAKEEILGLIMLPGFSSVKQVSEISGRGVGMDVVAEMVKQFGGTIKIQSEPDQGSKFTLNFPHPVPGK